MGAIAGIVGAVGAAAGAVSTVSNLVGGSGGSPGAALNTVAGTGISAAAQQQAGQIQADAAQKAIDQQTATGQQVTGQYNPFLGQNYTAPVTAGLENLLGVGPSGSAGMLDQLQQTPGYQFTLGQGLQSVNSQLSAMGLAKSGSAIKGATQYAEGLAGTTYQNMVSNFLNGGTLGLNATNSYANAAFGNQGALNALTLNKGAASASGLVGAANVINSGFNNLNALNPNTYATPTTTNAGGSGMTYNGTPVGNAVGQQIATQDQYGSTAQSQVLSQNPYQIQAPSMPTTTYDPNSYIQPTLPTG